jgi:hypothetical protein
VEEGECFLFNFTFPTSSYLTEVYRNDNIIKR